MKKINIVALAAFIMMLMTLVTGCSVIEGIFKAGVWVGILIVVAVIGGVIWLVTRMGGRK